jgi:hypothetical protein
MEHEFTEADALRILRGPRRQRKTDRSQPVSFILRYGDSLFGVDTMAEHIAIEKRHGYVWLGKFGVGASKDRIDRVRAQLKDGTPTSLYLCSHMQITHEARILDIVGGGRANLRLAPEPSRVPKYYRDIGCAIWFKISGIRKARHAVLRRLRLANDTTSIPRLRTTQSLIMVVRARKRDEI